MPRSESLSCHDILRLVRRPGELGRSWIGSALEWLDDDENFDDPDATSLLRALLRRYDLDDDEVAHLFALTLEWLDGWGLREESDYVIRALLDRGDLDEGLAERARGAAFTWLERYGSTEEAQFVLRSLLLQEDLPREDARRAVERAIAWLDLHQEIREASFVLSCIFRHQGLGKGDGRRVIDAAMAWLELHGSLLDADFVLNPLVRLGGLPRECSLRCGELALAWFRQTPPEHDERRYEVLLGVIRNAGRYFDATLRAVIDEIGRGLPTAELPPELHGELLFKLRDVTRRLRHPLDVKALALRAPPGTVLPKASRSEFLRLASELTARALDKAAPVDIAWLRQALLETRRQLGQRAAPLATAALPGLLPLAARSKNEAIFADAAKTASEVLRSEQLDPRIVQASLRACHDLLGAWPDRDAGASTLSQITPRQRGDEELPEP